MTVSTATTEESRRLVQELYDAAIAAPGAARAYGLLEAATQIADREGAVTRFVVLRTGAPVPAPTGADRTTLLAQIWANRPGALLELLEHFAVRGIDLTRRFVFNLLFVLVLVLVLVVLTRSGPVLQERSTLVLAPKGQIVEQYSADPMSRALARAVGEDLPETQLRDILRVLDAAAEDKRIERLVIRPDRITGVGYAALREIGAAITRGGLATGLRSFSSGIGRRAAASAAPLIERRIPSRFAIS